ncbi:Peroxidase 68, partial [Zea mays]
MFALAALPSARGRGERQPAASGRVAAGAAVRVRRQGPGRAGPDGAVGRAHGGARPLRGVPRPHLQRHRHHRRQLRGGPPGRRLPLHGRRRQPGAAGAAGARRLRQRLLPGPGRAPRAASLGPGAVRQRRRRGQHHGRARARVRRQRDGLRGRLRRRHGEDGEPGPARGERGRRRGPAQLPPSELIVQPARARRAICIDQWIGLLSW